MHLLNKNKGTADFTFSSRSKPKLSDQENMKNSEKNFSSNPDKRKQERSSVGLAQKNNENSFNI